MSMIWDPTRQSAVPYYDLTALSFNNSYDMASEDTGVVDIMWKPDGLKLYMLGIDNLNVYSYTLSTAYDVTTASFLNSFSIGSEDDLARGISWNDDGTKFYLVGFRDSIYSYSCSTAYDISTASVLNSKDLSSNTENPNCIDWNGDGTKFYIIDDFNEDLRSWTLSTAYDITTATYNNAANFDPVDDNMKDIDWNDDGSKLFTIGNQNDSAYSFTCSTNYDITTATHLNSFDVSSEENDVRGSEWDDIGSQFYVVGLNNIVYSYKVT